MADNLTLLTRAWQAWAPTADQSEDGWQSDFPDWRILMALACDAMRDAELQSVHLMQIEQCWAWSEETEDLLDCAVDAIDICWPVLTRLVRSDAASVRWQVYAALAAGGPGAKAYLRAGLDDSDGYCRRRALLALAQLEPGDAADLQRRFRNDSDPYMRQVAASLTQSSTCAPK